MTDALWWQHAVVYQVYPRSFQDTNGDGVGDIPGVTQRLDYLRETLGVDALWLSPFYPSPMADFGYDVADYTDVDPLFGSLDDFDRLVTEAHRRGLKVIIDWVPNHTSDQHAWFQESRASRDRGKRDWYVWRDPKADGSPPNNWLSVFGGPAWTLDERTGQYYLHSFVPGAAAGPQLAQPRSARSNVRHPALLAGAGGGWLPHRRGAQYHERSGAAR
jgi:alpha-glucosidase